MSTITVTTANICGNPIRARRAVWGRMDQALGIAGVTFGQECAQSNRFRIGRGNYSHAWHRIAHQFGKVTEGGPREVPISLSADFDVLSAESRLMHKGKRMVSPNRYATIVLTLHGGKFVAFVNCHTVSKPRRGVPFSRWRISRFASYLEQLATIVSDLHARGYTVVYGGDMNHRAPLPQQAHPDERVLIESGLDHLWIVPAPGVTITHQVTSRVPRTVLMDHPILSARFTLGSN